MSLRPSFAGFGFAKLLKLIGSRDAEVLPTLYAQMDETYDDEPHRARGREILAEIVNGKLDVEVEDEDTQVAVVCMVQATQELEESESGFWEEFLVDISRAKWPIPGAPDELIRGLVNGRPLFGKVARPDWTRYACLTNNEARSLFDFIRGQERYREAYDYAGAARWMDEIERDGLDVFYFAS